MWPRARASFFKEHWVHMGRISAASGGYSYGTASSSAEGRRAEVRVKGGDLTRNILGKSRICLVFLRFFGFFLDFSVSDINKCEKIKQVN